MRQRIKIAIRIVFSVVLITYLCYYVQWHKIGVAIRSITLFPFLVSTAFALLATYVVAWKYFLLVKGTALERSAKSLFQINLVSRYYALFLPSMGADAVRWYKVTKNQAGKTFFAAATLYERLTLYGTLLLCTTVAFLLVSTRALAELQHSLFIPVLFLSAVVIGGLGYMVSGRVNDRINMVLRALLPRRLLEKQPISGLLDGLNLRALPFKSHGGILFFSVVWQILFVLRIHYLFQSMNLHLSLMDAAWIGSFVLLLQILPISFAGIGIREGAYSYLLVLYGLPAEKGLSVGLLFFSQMIFLAALGAVIEITGLDTPYKLRTHDK